jgi:stearoyl-CoA desaturase (delta-9 desaturase)
MLPAVVGLYQESNINVQCHTPGIGYRNFETGDDSRNVSILAWTSWGQGWHNNHHAKPYAWSNWEKWWEWDVPSLVIRMIKK